MTWFPIENVAHIMEHAMEFAYDTIPQTYNRMGYGNSTAELEKLYFHIYIGKLAEQIVFRYLREELNLRIIESTHRGSPDEYDFQVEHDQEQVTGDIKSCHVYPTWNGQPRTPKQVERECWALVPVDQYEGRPKDLYVFSIILGDAKSSTDPGLCFIRWATHSDISSWDFIPKGRRRFPYNNTKTNNYGNKISECRIIEDLPDYLYFAF